MTEMDALMMAPEAAETEADASGSSGGEEEEGDDEGLPEADPETCQALALCLPHFQEGVDRGEWDDTDFRYYLEPMGVLQTRLVCQRCDDDQRARAGLFMTRSGLQARAVFLDDGLNPQRYDLSFPKEVGYVKALAHYQDLTRAHAKYPFSKKY